MEETEVWKSLDFIGYPDYEVSNMGRVKTLNKYVNSSYGSKQLRKEKILKGKKDKDGYIEFGLYKNGKVKYFRGHRLVALTFLENPYNLPIINHKNEIKDDNRVENLEWCSVRYNNNYGTKIERFRKSKKIPILQYTLDNIFIREWDSATTASRELNIYQQHICSCCKGKRNKCGGFIWKYKESI